MEEIRTTPDKKVASHGAVAFEIENEEEQRLLSGSEYSVTSKSGLDHRKRSYKQFILHRMFKR